MITANPFVSVIVPVRNGEDTIGGCLAALLRMNYPAQRREIVVVDNGSQDRTPEIVRRHPVVLVRELRRGAAAARNRGVDASSGGILAFTDADCLVSAGWLSELVRGFDGPAVAAVEGETVAFRPTTTAERYMARCGSHSHQRRRLSPFYPYLITANAAVRREAFQQVGGFDAGFQDAAEDIDFSWRLLANLGVKIRYKPRAIVFHQHRSSVAAFLAQHVRNGRGLARLHRKYPAKLPWNWRQEAAAWSRVARRGWSSAGAGARYLTRVATQKELCDAWLEFLGAAGIRIGFDWQRLPGLR